MKKFINITIIILLLIAVCVVEQVLADKYLAEVEIRVDKIYENFIALDNINDTKLIAQTNELEEYWTAKESVLCNFVNHKDIEDIGVEINKMQTATKNSNKEQYYESLKLVKFYLMGYKHVIGISIQNIF